MQNVFNNTEHARQHKHKNKSKQLSLERIVMGVVPASIYRRDSEWVECDAGEEPPTP